MPYFFDKAELSTIPFPPLKSIQKFDTAALVVKNFSEQCNL